MLTVKGEGIGCRSDYFNSLAMICQACEEVGDQITNNSLATFNVLGGVPGGIDIL